jgi:hypothetical protein
LPSIPLSLSLYLYLIRLLRHVPTVGVLMSRVDFTYPPMVPNVPAVVAPSKQEKQSWICGTGLL